MLENSIGARSYATKRQAEKKLFFQLRDSRGQWSFKVPGVAKNPTPRHQRPKIDPNPSNITKTQAKNIKISSKIVNNQIVIFSLKTSQKAKVRWNDFGFAKKHVFD